ncbi:MAG: hypothetical protein U9Q61_10940 [Thermodesulfobacteriota bacterium]|nr:hypothetical protein [Thermodesulfobacteriota bacterium]
MNKKLIMSLVLGVLVMVGCAGTATKQAEMSGPQQLMSKDGNFFIYDYMERHYVVGSEESSQKFAAHGHLPYTKTVLGAGPHGETVVYEVAKKDPALAERLMEIYSSIPFVVETTGDNYTVYKKQGRLFVVGDAKMKEFFAAHGHLPYTKTLLGAGPAGETVVFQVDKKDPKFVERLMSQFKG